MDCVMKRGIKGGVLFPPGWLEHTSATPALASKEIEHAYVELDRIQNENSRVRQERDEMRRGVEQWQMAYQSVEAELDNERRAVRSSKAARMEAERLLDKYRQLSDIEVRKAQDVERALSKEKDHTCPMNLYRTGGDIGPNFDSVIGEMYAMVQYADRSDPFNHPGCWAYPDMRSA